MFKVTKIVEPLGELQVETRNLEPILSSLSPEAVLVKTQAAGVCHTDIHLWHGCYKVGRSDEDLLKFAERPGFSYPIVPGHEMAGLVHTLGSEASSSCSLVPGDRVAVYPWIGCNRCPVCSRGDSNHCPVESKELGFCSDGGYSEYVVVPHYRYVLRLPERISFSVGAQLPCGSLTAYTALKKCKEVVKKFQGWEQEVFVAVIGLGGLGQWALNLLPHCLGKEGVKAIGIDISKRKLEIVKEAGLVEFAFSLSLKDKMDEQARTIHAKLGHRPCVVLDFVNSTETFSLCVHLLAPTGVHVLVGLHGGVGGLCLPLAALSGATHVGNLVGSLVDFQELLDLMGLFEVSSPKVQYYTLVEAGQALRDLEQGLVDGRAILNMQ